MRLAAIAKNIKASGVCGVHYVGPLHEVWIMTAHGIYRLNGYPKPIDRDETVQLGMMMALSAYVIFDIIFEGFTFGQHFTLCLQMGVTRKNFLSSYVIFKVIKNMLALSIIAIIG